MHTEKLKFNTQYLKKTIQMKNICQSTVEKLIKKHEPFKPQSFAKTCNTFGPLTNLELTLNTTLASLAVVNLTCVVIIHNFYKLTRQCRMLETNQ